METWAGCDLWGEKIWISHMTVTLTRWGISSSLSSQAFKMGRRMYLRALFRRAELIQSRPAHTGVSGRSCAFRVPVPGHTWYLPLQLMSVIPGDTLTLTQPIPYHRYKIPGPSSEWHCGTLADREAGSRGVPVVPDIAWHQLIYLLCC